MDVECSTVLDTVKFRKACVCAVVERVFPLVEGNTLVKVFSETLPLLEVELDPCSDRVLKELVQRSGLSLEESVRIRGCEIDCLVVEERRKGVDVEVERFKLEE